MRLSESKVILLFIAFAILIIGVLFLIFENKNKTQDNSTSISHQSELLTKLSEGVPNSSWSNPENINQSAGTYGEMEGQKITSTITTKDAMPVNFDEKTYLESLGYKEDSQLAAGGPGSSVWGYSKTVDGVTSVVVFSSQTAATNSDQNAPAEFNCPCQTQLSIFVSTPPPSASSQSSSASTIGLANPASENCAKVGGTTSIQEGPNGQYGLCEFGDNMACEEWALYRKECPVGGVKTTGFDTKPQMYCAWVGGKTLAEPNATCTLPSGKVCSDEALYNGTCSNS